MKAVLKVLAVGLGLSAPALGQTGATPAEPPPADHAARDYVDSQGCAFSRGTLNGTTVWLSRVDGQGRAVCGLAPSFPAPQAGGAGAPLAVVDGAGEAAKAAITRAKPPARRQMVAAIPADRLVIAVGSVAASDAGCDGPNRAVPLVTFRNGARHAACAGLRGNPQALALEPGGAPTIGPALPPLDAPATMVHVGAYRVPANAERAAGRLRAMGLPVARSTAGGGLVALVMTGPVGAGQAAELVARLRAAGFADAYPDVAPGRNQPSQIP